jgi:hypothetical protein
MSPECRRELAADTLYHISRCDHNADQIAAIESAFLEIEREVREECAKVCESLKIRNKFARNEFPQAESGFNDGIHECAAAIREGK